MVRVDKYWRGSAVANGEGFVDLSSGDTFAAVEAVEINQDAGDVNRTNPKFIGREEPFSIGRTAELLEEMVCEFNIAREGVRQ